MRSMGEGYPRPNATSPHHRLCHSPTLRMVPLSRWERILLWSSNPHPTTTGPGVWRQSRISPVKPHPGGSTASWGKASRQSPRRWRGWSKPPGSPASFCPSKPADFALSYMASICFGRSMTQPHATKVTLLPQGDTLGAEASFVSGPCHSDQLCQPRVAKAERIGAQGQMRLNSPPARPTMPS